MVKKMEMCIDTLKYFGSSWSMKANRAQELIATLSDQDKKKFSCNPRDIDWEQYMATYFHGVNKFLLKNS